MNKSDEIIKLAEMQKQSVNVIDINKIADMTYFDRDYIRHILNESGIK